MMKQFFSMKAKHPGALMLFRCGDFYETYGEDAVVSAGILGITLTKRNNSAENSVEMAGFPHHALDTYLPKLIRAGKRVAICDQLEDPKKKREQIKGKKGLTEMDKMVKRGITELVTPGREQFSGCRALRKGFLWREFLGHFDGRIPHRRRLIRLC